MPGVTAPNWPARLVTAHRNGSRFSAAARRARRSGSAAVVRLHVREQRGARRGGGREPDVERRTRAGGPGRAAPSAGCRARACCSRNSALPSSRAIRAVIHDRQHGQLDGPLRERVGQRDGSVRRARRTGRASRSSESWPVTLSATAAGRRARATACPTSGSARRALWPPPCRARSTSRRTAPPSAGRRRARCRTAPASGGSGSGRGAG